MAHQPAIRPDPSSFDPPEEPGNDPQNLDAEDPDPSLVLAELARTLAQHGGGNSSEDLALDLVLNEIVQQACLATMATGAAAALVQEGELVVRATTGLNAPELGVRLSMQAGLSGACLQTGQVQLCEDTRSDPRVDAATCTELHIQSILAVPISDGHQVLGLLEIFSNRRFAFGERDEQTLQALSWRIVNTLSDSEHSDQPPLAAPVQVSEDKAAKSPTASQAEGPMPPEHPVQPLVRQRPKRDYPTFILTVLVIAVAMLLGWMYGRPRWQVNQAAPATEPSATANRSLEPVPAETQQVAPSNPVQKKAKPQEPPPGTGLVVYDKGKIIYESPSQRGLAATPRIPKISSAIAGGLLVFKVSPEYPEPAKQEQVEGPVNLEITVGEDGLVRDVKVASGDARLASAATEAVRQWKFRSYEPQGKATAFKTSVVVKFNLAGSDREVRNP